jgi:hypothetical protein
MVILLPVVPVFSNAIDDKEDEKTLRIPLRLSKDSNDSKDNKHCWKVLKFKNRKPNKVVCDEKGLHVKVQCSANLLVYPLDVQTEVNSIILQGAVTGLPRIPEGKKQGDKRADDFAIRFGLVIAGKKRLNPIEKIFASELVRYLFAQAPKSKGLDHVLFLNLANEPAPKWQKRTHPIGKGLLREQVACVKDTAGDFIIKAEFQKPLQALALCIICDGDHTKSEFQVTVKDIQLNPQRRKEK